jgi:DNA-binding transcriptional LysR family regulator
MDTLTSLKVFRQVVNLGSFVRAAEHLDMSTAMVSKHVMHLERRLGVRLLNRTSRASSLTEPGNVYFERCKSLLDELHATELELGSLSRSPRGTLRVSVPSSAMWLADLLVEYRHLYPEVLVDLSCEDRLVDLADEGYDAALRIVSDQASLQAGLIARPIRASTFYLAASHDYIRQRGAPNSLEDLAQHEIVAVGNLLSSLERPVGSNRLGIHLRPILRYRSMSGVANAIAAGIGIGPLPSVLFEDPLFRKALVPVLPEYPLKRAMLYVVYSSNKLVPAKVKTFIAFIAERLSTSVEPKARVALLSKPRAAAILTLGP